MIKVYSWPTPNGHKVHVMLEECGLRLGRDWQAIPVNIGTGDQFSPEFLAISPNNRIPALVDPNGPDGKPIALFESGAILLYLAAKTAKFLPKTDRLKFQTLQWLMFQMGGVGPMIGQTHHFRQYAPEKIAYAIDRYTNETRRLYGVMTGNSQAANLSPATSTRWPTLRFSRGCVTGPTTALTGLITRISSAGMTRLQRGRPCSAALQYWLICASR